MNRFLAFSMIGCNLKKFSGKTPKFKDQTSNKTMPHYWDMVILIASQLPSLGH